MNRQTCRVIKRCLSFLALFALSTVANASFWDDLWKTPHQQNKQKLGAGEFESLTADGVSTDWAGVGHYRSGNFAEAIEKFKLSEDITGLYNHGTALTQDGDYEKAQELFNQVLEQDPNHEKAAKNLEIAKQLQEIQREQKPQDGKQGEEGQNEDREKDEQQQGDQESEQENADKQEGQQQDSEQQSGEQQEQEAGDQSDDGEASDDQQAAAEEESDQLPGEDKEPQELSTDAKEQDESMTENEQATEQWLRRIPDDPTGLLRRKLQRSHSTDYPGVGDGVVPW